MTEVILLIRVIEYDSADVLGVFSSRDLASAAFREYRRRRDPLVHPKPPSGFPIDVIDLAASFTDKCVKAFENGSDEVVFQRDEHYVLETVTIDTLIKF